ncbi:MAG: HDIG domain-containing protein [Candidatus Palauibacterales bacterium]|nr:HDIG domain-containing protein [Candidatus Palauibacterales bacterium]MDP2529837.1 HDIG domain-containing protein [Candidatus Palauibacterales bacterium]MDP2583505.1 HDIG domain-containing protein [Candidatus Palauibacterales bacterium]
MTDTDAERDEALPSRAEALALVEEYTDNLNLRRHMFAVEAAMRAYAGKYGEDPERWGLAGLLHDFDYERWPNDEHAADREHPSEGVRILREQGYPEDILHAILAHADYTGVPAQTRMDRALRAVDELTGFIVACSLVRPHGIMDLEPRSVKKKMKDSSFAAAVDRDEMRAAAEELGEEWTEHVTFVIGAMRGIVDDLGLRGREG